MSDLNYLTFCHVTQILIEATGIIGKAHYTHTVEVIFARYDFLFFFNFRIDIRNLITIVIAISH